MDEGRDKYMSDELSSSDPDGSENEYFSKVMQV